MREMSTTELNDGACNDGGLNDGKGEKVNRI